MGSVIVAQFGSLQFIVVCVPVPEATSPQQQAVCPVSNGQNFAPKNMQAYVIEPSQQGAIEASMGPFDYSQGATVWAAAFSMVVGLYFVSAAIGAVLSMIRRG